MIRRPPRSTLFPYNDALPICLPGVSRRGGALGWGAGASRLGRRALAARPGECRARRARGGAAVPPYHVRGQRSEEHTSELQSQSNLVCRLLLEKKKKDTSRSG